MVRSNSTTSRKLRAAMTDAERLLWQKLRRRQIAGARFRRQFVIAPFIVDFACLEQKLVIELDGGQHDQQSADDRQRTQYLYRFGWRVLRFWNNEVFNQLDAVVEVITASLAPPP